MIAPDACDKTGAPICVDQYNFSPSEVLSKLTVPEYLNFIIHCLEYKMLIVEQLSDQKEHHNIEVAKEKLKDGGLYTSICMYISSCIYVSVN